MKNRSFRTIVFLSAASFSLISCTNVATATIYFELNGGSFNDPEFSVDHLTGYSGTPITINIPDPQKDGYYFVGWEEPVQKGSNIKTEVNKTYYSKDGNYYYFYPYQNTTFYAHFEPLAKIDFDFNLPDEFKESNISFVTPELNPSDFYNNALNGYVGKTITSSKCFPTLRSDNTHIKFLNWYTKYPLIEVSIDDKTYYQLDKSGEIGKYYFDESFSKSNIQFPLYDVENEVFKLYADWSIDPLITLHLFSDEQYNSLETKPEKKTITFRCKDKLQNDIFKAVKDSLNLDLTKYQTGENRFYYGTQNDGSHLTNFYRFSGFKTRDYKKDDDGNPTGEYTESDIYADASINKDTDIYMSWEQKLQFTLDFDGGHLKGTSDTSTSQTISSFYENDILASYTDTDDKDFFKTHVPIKENNSFLYYGLASTDDQGNINYREFNFYSEPITKEIRTLKAIYDPYPLLTLKLLPPTNYNLNSTDTELTNLYSQLVNNGTTYSFEKGSSINDDRINIYQSFVNQLMNNDNSFKFEDLVIDTFYMQKTDQTYQECMYGVMQDTDATLYLKLLYRPKYELFSKYGIYNNPNSYQDCSGSTSQLNIGETYVGANNIYSGSKTECQLTQALYDQLESKETNFVINNETYFFDGLYKEDTFLNEVKFPLVCNCSESNAEKYTLYRKLTKGLKLYFILKSDLNETYLNADPMYIKPLTELNIDKVNTFLNANYSKMYVKNIQDPSNSLPEFSQITTYPLLDDDNDGELKIYLE